MNNFEKTCAFEKRLSVEHPDLYLSMEWAVLRFYFFFSFGRFKRKSPRLPATLIFKKVIKSLGNNIKVFFKYFLKADVWVLSNNAETRWHDGQKINKVLHSVLAESDSLVFFERYLRPKNETTDYSNRFDFFFFETQIRVISFFINLFYSSEKISKLQAEFTKDGLEEVNFAHKRWCQFLASKILWRVLLTIKKPKLVLITDYHNAINMALVYQLKKMNIKSVEYQHGIISPKHPAYMYDPKVAEKGRPDYLVYFSLPNKWENTIAYDAKKVVFSSSYILQECQKKRDGYIDNHSGDQRKSKPRVLVSLQNSSIQETTDFVCQAISRFKEGEFEFILLPRDKQPQIPFNRSDVHVENDMSIYELLATSDLHVTHFSTTALEARMLGTVTCVLAFDSMAEDYFNDFHGHSDDFYYAKSVDEFAQFLEAFKKRSTLEPTKPLEHVQNKTLTLRDLADVMDVSI